MEGLWWRLAKYGGGGEGGDYEVACDMEGKR